MLPHHSGFRRRELANEANTTRRYHESGLERRQFHWPGPKAHWQLRVHWRLLAARMAPASFQRGLFWGLTYPAFKETHGKYWADESIQRSNYLLMADRIKRIAPANATLS